MNQLLCHLSGDYLLQNSWMAKNKGSKTFPCIVHCLLYTICFVFVTQNLLSLLLIFSTHFLLDRFEISKKYALSKMDSDTPEYAKWSISIVVDNTVHLIINYLILIYIG